VTRIAEAQLVGMFDTVFKGLGFRVRVIEGHEEIVEKRRRGKCVYCKETGVSSKKKGYTYTYYYCAACQAYVHLSAGSSFTVAKL